MYNAGPTVDVAAATLAPRPEGVLYEAVAREGMQIMSIGDQFEHFKGCVYVQAMKKVWMTDGTMLGK